MPPPSCFITLLAQSCCHLVAAAARLPARLCCVAMVWTVAFLTLPIRLLTAIERENKLGGLVGEMQAQMDRLVWENKELEEKLQMALKDQKAMEAILDEIEEEHEDAFARIDQLESQLRDLEEENRRLNECKGKSLWEKNAHGKEVRNVSDVQTTVDTDIGARSPWSPRPTGTDGIMPQDLLKSADPYTVPPESVSGNLAMEDALKQGKMIAHRRSLFSLFMSLAVGVIIWKADAPCLPLITGLFIVVGLSMRSVGRFSSSLKNKPASDAVALLSLNWFLLGMLTSPMLPGLARTLVPWAVRLAAPMVAWLGVPV